MTTDSKIGVFLLSANNPHQVAMGRLAEEAAKARGVALEVLFSDDLAAQQAQNVIRFLHANEGRRLGVILMPVADVGTGSGSIDDHPVHKLARRVASRGAAWVVLNRDASVQVTALRQEFPNVPAFLVTPDQREFGRVQGRQYQALLPRGGRMLYVVGNPFASSTLERRLGMREIVGRNTALEIHEVDGLWSADGSRRGVAKWLKAASRRAEWPLLVGCQNDEMALGARAALDEAANLYGHRPLRQVPVTGGDGLPDHGQRWVLEKKIRATVVAPLTTVVAVEQLIRAWETGRSLAPVSVLPVSAFPAPEQLSPISLPEGVVPSEQQRLDAPSVHQAPALRPGQKGEAAVL